MYPRISVVMSVRNGLPYLSDAVQSILQQSEGCFEFIILDNASTDGSFEWLARLQDSRIRLVRNDYDLGLSGSLNKGFALAKGKYIARMDADDISLPNRFALQADFMDTHPQVVVCGGEVEVFDHQASRLWGVPCGQDAMLATLLFGVPIAHPAAMYRTSIWHKFLLQYDESLSIVQDYDMWRQIGFVYHLRMDNVRDCVLRYRKEGQNLSSNAADIHAGELKIVYARILEDIFDKKAANIYIDEYMLGKQCANFNVDNINIYMRWLLKFKKSIIKKNIIDSHAVRMKFSSHMLETLKNASLFTLLYFLIVPIAKCPREYLEVQKIILKVILLKLKYMIVHF